MRQQSVGVGRRRRCHRGNIARPIAVGSPQHIVDAIAGPFPPQPARAKRSWPLAPASALDAFTSLRDVRPHRSARRALSRGTRQPEAGWPMSSLTSVHCLRAA